jgi:hypothetical protein
LVATAIGIVLRLRYAQQSIFGDEVATYFVVAHNGLGDVISTVHGDAEITPPLGFVATWLTTRISLAPEFLRAPSLIAGALAIPMSYLIGLRTVGRPAALLAAALTALSPFMIYNSAQARAYELAVVLVMASTFSLLAALDSGERRRWIAYGVSSCAAMYSHYTAGFALAAQLLWVFAAHPEARSKALLANAGAAIAYLPWLSGIAADFNSPTTTFLSVTTPFDLSSAARNLSEWSIGYPFPYTDTVNLKALPGIPAIVLLLGALVIAIGGAIARLSSQAFHLRAPRLTDRRLLVIALALAAPIGEAIASAISTNVLSVEGLAVSWPGFALSLSALMMAAGPRLKVVTASLTLACFCFGAARVMEERFQRPDYDAVAAFVEERSQPGDVVVDGAVITPVPLTPLEIAMDGQRPIFNLGQARVRLDPYAILALPPTPEQVAARAARAAAGCPIFVVDQLTPLRILPVSSLAPAASAALPSSYRAAETNRYPGILNLGVTVYAESPNRSTGNHPSCTQ